MASRFESRKMAATKKFCLIRTFLYYFPRGIPTHLRAAASHHWWARCGCCYCCCCCRRDAVKIWSRVPRYHSVFRHEILPCIRLPSLHFIFPPVVRTISPSSYIFSISSKTCRLVCLPSSLYLFITRVWTLTWTTPLEKIINLESY